MKKFPRTHHLLNLGSATRDDLIFAPSDLTPLLSIPCIVQEKIDGANLGFSLSPSLSDKILVQNRSHYLSYSSSSNQEGAQFAALGRWVEKHEEALRKILGRDDLLKERYVLYGEWMAAVHSIEYSALPDYFLAFDLYDRLEDRFAPPDILRSILKDTGIHTVPELWRGVLNGEDILREFLERKSIYGEGKVEGVVVRFENGKRGKVVREDFIAGDRHWSKNKIRKNEILRDSTTEGVEE
jgi:atypical dual specificity phosphatase